MADNDTSALKVGDRVRLTADYGFSGAVPLGLEGVIVEMIGRHHISVDFGQPYYVRGCAGGSNLELVTDAE